MVVADVDFVDKSPSSCRVKVIDIVALIYAIILHFVDVGFDIFLAYSYFITEQYSYFAWTAAFTIIPTIIMTALSIRMYIDDSHGSLNSLRALFRPCLCILGLFLQLAPVIRWVSNVQKEPKFIKYFFFLEI